MTGHRRGVLLTRPSEGAVELAMRVAALGFTPVSNPLMELTPTGVALPSQPFDGIVFTSQAAVRAYPIDDSALHTPVYTVGEHTAETARQRGFRSVLCAGEDVASLAALLRGRAWPADSVLLYASGVLVANDLAALMGSPPPRIMRVPLYASRGLCLQKNTIARLYEGDIGSIMLFSTRTAEILARELDRLDRLDWIAGVSLVCISSRVAEPVARFAWKAVAIARRPVMDAMLECLSVGGGSDGRSGGKTER
jgi:uroporphyrinogen-III synthase